MECTQCHKILDIRHFAYKNEVKKIYYQHCNACREKIRKSAEQKARDKENYEIQKIGNIIQCRCGKKFIAFRDYHVMRHLHSKNHISTMSKIPT